MEHYSSLVWQGFNSTPDSVIDRRFYHNCVFLPHFHTNPELIYVFDGCMSATIDGNSMTIQKGEFCMILPSQIHTFSCKENQDYNCVIFVFPQRYIISFINNTAGYRGETQVFRADDEILSLFLKYIFKSDTFNEYIFSCVMYGLCHDFVSQCKLTKSVNNKFSDIQLEMLNYISLHFRENISLRDMSKVLGYNYYYLSHVFHDYIGISFQQYLNVQRIDCAKCMLERSSSSITDIAFQCGFENIRAFNRTFKQTVHVTPSEYKRQLVQNNVSQKDAGMISHPKFIENRQFGR